MTKELLDILRSDIYTDDGEYAERVAKIKQWAANITMATDTEVQEARDITQWVPSDYIDDYLEINEEAQTSVADDGVWVQAWVWLQDSDLGPDGKPRGER